MNIPSYRVRPGQVISLGKKAMEMIVIRHNLDVLDRSVVGWLEVSDGGSKVTVRDVPQRPTSTSPSASSSSSSSTRSNAPSSAHHQLRGTSRMLVIQRPTVEAAGEVEGNRQQFTVGPLEPGFGYTIGNSLRRTLLSSIPGAAITMVRFDDALHEFDTITGVAEDVTDVILNLKDIVLTSSSDDPVVIRLDIRGPADVAAGDIKLPPEIEILNRDAHIATVNEGPPGRRPHGRAGRGYLSSDRETQNRTIGVIPIDAIFSPVRRVTFTVEPARVEQSTNFDRLQLDIETDGSITPKEALASAGATLRSLVDLVANLSDDPQGLELGEVASVAAARRTSSWPSRTSTCPSDPATA